MSETKEEAIGRAYGAMKKVKTFVALYWVNGKLSVSMPESSMHKRRMAIHGDNLIGIYVKGIAFSFVAEDIDEFY